MDLGRKALWKWGCSGREAKKGEVLASSKEKLRESPCREAPFFQAGPGLEPVRPWCSLTEALWHWTSTCKGWSSSFKWLLLCTVPRDVTEPMGGGVS